MKKILRYKLICAAILWLVGSCLSKSDIIFVSDTLTFAERSTLMVQIQADKKLEQIDIILKHGGRVRNFQSIFPSELRNDDMFTDSVNEFLDYLNDPQSNYFEIEKLLKKSGIIPNTKREIDRKIINNLRYIASSAMQYMLEKGTDTVKYSDLIGWGKDYFKGVNSVYGESYENITVKASGNAISVTDSSGTVHEYVY